MNNLTVNQIQEFLTKVQSLNFQGEEFEGIQLSDDNPNEILISSATQYRGCDLEFYYDYYSIEDILSMSVFELNEKYDKELEAEAERKEKERQKQAELKKQKEEKEQYQTYLNLKKKFEE